MATHPEKTFTVNATLGASDAAGVSAPATFAFNDFELIRQHLSGRPMRRPRRPMQHVPAADATMPTAPIDDVDREMIADAMKTKGEFVDLGDFLREQGL